DILQRSRDGEPIVHFETTRLTKAAKRVPVSLTISPLRDATGRVVGTANIARDISAQKRAEDALSNVNRKLIEAQEKERARIARELHDDIGQRLALLATELTMLTSSADGHLHAFELQSQASELAADVQALSHDLHSSKLDLLGVATGMRSFCKE